MSATPPWISDELLAALYERAEAARWNTPAERFSAAIRNSCERNLPADADRARLERYVHSLHLNDLALACACADGDSTAWEHFMREVQPRVRAAALAIAGSGGADLADALAGDLFGHVGRSGERRSLFHYFHGRSRLTTWLRTVLAQRHIDALRDRRRTVSLDEPAGAESGERVESPRNISGKGDWRRQENDAAATGDRTHVLAIFEKELRRAIDALPAGDRLRLSFYYVQELTLARIGRLLGEHESSVSRKLERTRRLLREQVERALREEHRLSEADLRQCYEETAQHGTLELEKLLRSESSP